MPGPDDLPAHLDGSLQGGNVVQCGLRLVVEFIDRQCQVVGGFLFLDGQNAVVDLRLADLLLATQAVEKVPGKPHPDQRPGHQVFPDAGRIEGLFPE